jgi:biopolymer transport protein ExbD
MQRATIVWAAIVLFLFVVGCGQSTQQTPPKPSGEMLRVHVTAAGAITADGREVSLEDLKKEFARLAAAGGSMLYTRDNPTADPHPDAMKVIQAAADANLPILMPDK